MAELPGLEASWVSLVQPSGPGPGSRSHPRWLLPVSSLFLGGPLGCGAYQQEDSDPVTLLCALSLPWLGPSLVFFPLPRETWPWAGQWTHFPRR